MDSDEHVLRAAFGNRGEALGGGGYVFGGSALVLGGGLAYFGEWLGAVATVVGLGGVGVAMLVHARRLNRRSSPVLGLLLERPAEIESIEVRSVEMGTLFTFRTQRGVEERVNVMGDHRPLFEVVKRRCVAKLIDLRD